MPLPPVAAGAAWRADLAGREKPDPWQARRPIWTLLTGGAAERCALLRQALSEESAERDVSQLCDSALVLVSKADADRGNWLDLHEL